jgi:hypothetical protein
LSDDNDRNIVILDHAKIRILERGILEEEVKMIINNPIQTIFDDYEENYKSYGIIEDKYNANNKKYIVIVHNSLNSNPVKIITGMVTSKGGLKRFGFNNI